MPYRRLPNTDASRLKAMEDAINRSMKVLPSELAFSQKSHQRLRYFLPSFRQALDLLKDIQKNQVERNKEFYELQKNAKTYISHFMQVLNLSIQRGEISEEARKFYDLEYNSRKLPSLNTEQELIEWGKNLIDGEAMRMTRGGAPIMNPRIALVKVKYEQFLEASRNQKFIQKSYNRAHDKIVELRPEADSIILDIWNEVEANYEDLPTDEKRSKSAEYGVHYVLRPSEFNA